MEETDFHRLDFKLGHQRRLQREVASMRGLPPWRPLDQEYDDFLYSDLPHQQRLRGGYSDTNEGGLFGAKDQFGKRDLGLKDGRWLQERVGEPVPSDH